MELIRIAHISDLHFSKTTLNPLQFFSKRWLGNLNLIFSRKGNYLTQRLFPLVDLFKELGVQHVIITGDLTTTSRRQEYLLANQLIAQFKEAGLSVLALPGNHDHYTKKACLEKRFYQFCDTPFNEHGIAVKSLGGRWWVIALDTAIATSLISSRGYFSPLLEKHLEETLSQIPQGDSVLLANHFPFFDHDSPRKMLVRGDALKNLIARFPAIKFYLHGHTHRHCLADLRPNGLPILLDSGSTPHRIDGAWNLIDLTPSGSTVRVYRWKDGWKPTEQAEFSWT
jgi:3',5'-cyclic AMP phosphodiesterase CpdA